METAVQAAGLCVIGAVLALVVRRGSPETALLLALAATAAVIALVVPALGELWAFLRQLEAYSGALERVLEKKVARRVLYFLTPGETVEV